MGILAKRHSIKRVLDQLPFQSSLCAIRYRRNVEINWGNDVKLFGRPHLELSQGSQLTVGDNCIFRSDRNSNPVGIDLPLRLCTLASTLTIQIGREVGISGGSICAREHIDIDSNTLIGANTYIFDNDFHPLDPFVRAKNDLNSIRTAPVIIGSNVFIGARCIILNDTTIGDNAIIGADSVVSGNIEANTVASGNPCCVRSRRGIDSQNPHNK